MIRDYCYLPIHSWEMLNGVLVPKDECGHYLDHDIVRGAEAEQLTSPYGTLHYAVGNSECSDDDYGDGDLTYFFDYARLPDKRYALHSVVNTESGGYIADADYRVVPYYDAPAVAMEFVQTALYAIETADIFHDEEGWNQDPFYFYRAVKASVDDKQENIASYLANWRELYAY